MPGINILSTTLHAMGKGASAWCTPQIDGHIEVEVPVYCFDDKDSHPTLFTPTFNKLLGFSSSLLLIRQHF